jgi:hypothetical protein
LLRLKKALLINTTFFKEPTIATAVSAKRSARSPTMGPALPGVKTSGTSTLRPTRSVDTRRDYLQAWNPDGLRRRAETSRSEVASAGAA